MLHEDIERCLAEVGYWLGQKYWGRGILTVALKAFTRYAFSEFELTRLYAVPFLRNPASIKVKDGQVLDQALYAYIANT